MYTTIIFLYFIRNIKTLNVETKKKSSNFTNFILYADDGYSIEIPAEICSRYEIFTASESYNKENYERVNSISCKRENEKLQCAFGKNILEKFYDLNMEKNELSLTPEEFLDLLGVLDYFQIIDTYKYAIYKKISESAVSGKIIDGLFIKNENTLEKKAEIGFEGDILFWHIFFNEVLKTFDLYLEKMGTSLKIANVVTKYIPKDFQEIDELLLESFIFYMDKVREDIDRFINILGGIFSGFLHINPIYSHIKKITIGNKCSNQEFDYFSSMFGDSFPNILTIGFRFFNLDVTLPDNGSKCDFELFLEKFPELESLELHLTKYVDEKSIEILLNIQNVQNTLTKVIMDRGANFQISAGLLTHDFPKLKELELNDFSFTTLVDRWYLYTSSILKPYISKHKFLPSNKRKQLRKLKLYNFEIEKNLLNLFDVGNMLMSLEILIIENVKIYREQAESIAKLANLKILSLINVKFDHKSIISKILESNNLQKSVIDLTLMDIKFNHENPLIDIFLFIDSRIARNINDFHCLKKLHLNIYIESSGFREMLSNRIFQTTIVDLYLPPGIYNIDSESISEFHGIKKLTIRGDVRAEVLKNLLDNAEFQVSLKELNLIVKDWSSEAYLGFSNLKSITKLNLSRCELTSEALNNILKHKNLQKSIEYLDLSCNKQIGDCCFETLANFEKMKRLILNETCLTIKSTTKIFKCGNLYKTLKELNISGNYGITMENAGLISNLKSLENLKINFCKLSYNVVSSILHCKNLKKSLRYLELDGADNISKIHIQGISTFDNLKFLRLRNCGLSFENITPLLKSKKLQSSLKVIYLEGNKKLIRVPELVQKFKEFKTKVYIEKLSS